VLPGGAWGLEGDVQRRGQRQGQVWRRRRQRGRWRRSQSKGAPGEMRGRGSPAPPRGHVLVLLTHGPDWERDPPRAPLQPLRPTGSGLGVGVGVGRRVGPAPRARQWCTLGKPRLNLGGALSAGQALPRRPLWGGSWGPQGPQWALGQPDLRVARGGVAPGGGG